MNILRTLLKMHECRETAKGFFGNEFDEKIKPAKRLIIGYQKKYGTYVLPSVLEICKSKSIKDNGMAVILIMAAAAELIENEK